MLSPFGTTFSCIFCFPFSSNQYCPVKFSDYNLNLNVSSPNPIQLPQIFSWLFWFHLHCLPPISFILFILFLFFNSLLLESYYASYNINSRNVSLIFYVLPKFQIYLFLLYPDTLHLAAVRCLHHTFYLTVFLKPPLLHRVSFVQLLPSPVQHIVISFFFIFFISYSFITIYCYCCLTLFLFTFIVFWISWNSDPIIQLFIRISLSLSNNSFCRGFKDFLFIPVLSICFMKSLILGYLLSQNSITILFTAFLLFHFLPLHFWLRF